MDIVLLLMNWQGYRKKTVLAIASSGRYLLHRKKEASQLPFNHLGRGEKLRTSAPLHPMQVRYQAALRPEHRAL